MDQTLLNVGFFWFPGRVSWIPLAPHEPYYCRRNWGGPQTIVVNQVNITRITINVRNYTYVNQAVVVNRDHFFDVNTYRNVRLANLNPTTIVSRYQAAPVVTNAERQKPPEKTKTPPSSQEQPPEKPEQQEKPR